MKIIILPLYIILDRGYLCAGADKLHYRNQPHRTAPTRAGLVCLLMIYLQAIVSLKDRTQESSIFMRTYQA
jgi:hypothetical protein